MQVISVHSKIFLNEHTCIKSFQIRKKKKSRIPEDTCAPLLKVTTPLTSKSKDNIAYF